MLRDLIYRTMMRPWVYRISCLVIFIVLMIGARFGIQQIGGEFGKNGLVIAALVGVPAMMLIGFWWERREGR